MSFYMIRVINSFNKVKKLNFRLNFKINTRGKCTSDNYFESLTQENRSFDNLTIKKATSLLKQIDKEVLLNDDLYYNKQAPIITDAEYDKLVRSLEFLENSFESLRGKSKKLNRVGIRPNISPYNKLFNHTDKLLSLDNAFTQDDLYAFCERVCKKLEQQLIELDREDESKPRRSPLGSPFSFILEPKIDGLSLALHYINSTLVRAGTRGDGLIGEGTTPTVYKTSTPSPILSYSLTSSSLFLAFIMYVQMLQIKSCNLLIYQKK